MQGASICLFRQMSEDVFALDKFFVLIAEDEDSRHGRYDFPGGFPVVEVEID